MVFEMSLFGNTFIEKQAVQEVMKCNELTGRFGLQLNETQALMLVETRSFALKENGRIEFGGGVIDKIINEFCDSPYLSIDNYEETLHELLELFYHYKNETMDLINDDELIEFMKVSFDGDCQGSLELLAGRELYHLARKLRYGYDPDAFNESEEFEEEDEEDEYGEY